MGEEHNIDVFQDFEGGVRHWFFVFNPLVFVVLKTTEFDHLLKSLNDLNIIISSLIVRFL